MDFTRGYTFGSSESVTNVKLHTLVDSGTGNNIVNADIASNAAIAYSKLALTGNITDADLSSMASISTSKINFAAGQLVPSGVILMWSGTIATIPSGYNLCDGTNSTPDLRDKFIVGAKQDASSVAKTNLTGSLTQSGGNVNHTHDFTHTHEIGGNTDTGSGHISENDKKFTTSSQSTTTTGNNSTVAVPYYALAFIQKS